MDPQVYLGFRDRAVPPFTIQGFRGQTICLESHNTPSSESSTGGHSGSLGDRLKVPHTTVYLEPCLPCGQGSQWTLVQITPIGKALPQSRVSQNHGVGHCESRQALTSPVHPPATASTRTAQGPSTRMTSVPCIHMNGSPVVSDTSSLHTHQHSHMRVHCTYIPFHGLLYSEAGFTQSCLSMSASRCHHHGRRREF